MSPDGGNHADEPESKPAPAPLDRIQALVNSLDIETGQDRLSEPESARTWLVGHGWLGADTPFVPPDLDTVREVRESVRTMLVHNAGGPAPTAGEWAALRGIAAAGGARAHLGDDGQVRLGVTGDSLRDRLVEVLLIIRDAQQDGTWARMKACANDDCRWAFYDKSKNRGGAWCTMAVCGNRLKNRDFRARQRTG